MFLVHNESKDALLKPYSERFKLFTELNDAIKFARSCGFELTEMGINTKEGICNLYWAGDIKVSIICLSVDKKIVNDKGC
jgi:hypothetical protein